MTKLSELNLKEGDRVKLLEAKDLGGYVWGTDDTFVAELYDTQLVIFGITQGGWHKVNGEWEVNGRRVYDYSGVISVSLEYLKNSINGGDYLSSSFAWSSTPEGRKYWLDQYDGNAPLDVKALKDMYLQHGGEPFWGDESVGSVHPTEDTFDFPIQSPVEENEPFDNVSKPKHYNHVDGGVECIDYIKQVLGKEGFVAYCRGNAMKYNHRLMYKGNPVEDMGKANQYSKWAEETLKEIQDG